MATEPTRLTKNQREGWDDAHFEEAMLMGAGLLDDGQPTRASFMRQRLAFARKGDPFTRDERRQIRSAMGLSDGD